MLTWGPKTSSTVVHTEISTQKLTVIFIKEYLMIMFQFERKTRTIQQWETSELGPVIHLAMKSESW
jgi:hypothetical protein